MIRSLDPRITEASQRGCDSCFGPQKGATIGFCFAATTRPHNAASFGPGGALLRTGGSAARPQDSSLQEFHDRGDLDRPPAAQSVGSGRGAAQVRGAGSAVRPALPQPAG